MKRQQAEKRGRQAERLAGWWLRLKGWQIVGRRLRTPAGEVDLVARRGSMLAFVEVKARATGTDLDLAIDERRLRASPRRPKCSSMTLPSPVTTCGST